MGVQVVLAGEEAEALVVLVAAALAAAARVEGGNMRIHMTENNDNPGGRHVDAKEEAENLEFDTLIVTIINKLGPSNSDTILNEIIQLTGKVPSEEKRYTAMRRIENERGWIEKAVKESLAGGGPPMSVYRLTKEGEAWLRPRA